MLYGGLLLAALAARVQAMPFLPPGSRAAGMGGAQVAAVEGPLSAVANPGALGYGAGGFAGWGSATFDLRGEAIEGAQDLYDIATFCPPSGGGGYCTDANALAAIRKLNGGALATATGGAAVKIGRVGVFADTLGAFGTSAFGDLANATVAGLPNNRSALILRGGFFSSLGAGYGSEVLESGVLVGGVARLVHGRMAFGRLPLAVEKPAPEAVFEKVNRSVANSIQPALDLGVVWDLQRVLDLTWKARLGLVGRNLNSPRFAMPSEAVAEGDPSSHYRLSAQARAGAAVSPASWLTFAADVDLTRNGTPLNDYFSRDASFGVELVAPVAPGVGMPVRFGAVKNLAEAESTNFTLGAGLRTSRVEVAIAGSPPLQRRRVQSLARPIYTPNRLSLAGTLTIRFGGAESAGLPQRKTARPEKAPAKGRPPALMVDSPKPARRGVPEGPIEWDVNEAHLWVR